MADATTTNIPTTDPALLAAQAKAGQAGVDAYNAAINTLQQQRATAVNSAMTATAARGIAEPGAGGDVGRMYDSRISQLQQGLGQFQANTASRAQRLTDYNAAVGSARSLIPGQVSMITAPIKAQGEYDVWKIGAQGRQDVDKITAQQALVQAQIDAMKAAAARAGGGGGRGGGGGGGSSSAGKLTGTNLRAELQQRAGAYAQATADQIAATGKDIEDKATGTKVRSQAEINQANFDTAGANYAGKAAQAYGQDVAAGKVVPGNIAANTPTDKAAPGSGFLGALFQGLKNNLAGIGRTAALNNIVQQRQTNLQSAGDATNTYVGGGGGMLGRFIPGRMGGPQEFQAPDTSAYVRSVIGQPGGLQAQAAQSGGIARNTIREQGVPGGSPYTPLQFPKQDDLINNIIAQRQGLTTQFDTPDQQRQYMVQAASDLANEGWKFNEADLANAIGYDSMPNNLTPSQAAAWLAGQPATTADQAAADVKTDKGKADAAEKEFSDATGLKFSDVAGSPDALYKVVVDPANAPTFKAKLNDMLTQVGTSDTSTIRQWVAKNVSDPVLRRVLIAIGTTAGAGTVAGGLAP